MFTINIYLKFALIALFLGGGIILSILYGIGYSWILILIGILLLLSYILLGTVQSAGEMVQTMDFDGAEKRLNLILSPKLLYVTNRAFYYIMKGSLAAQKKDNKTAEEYFNQALELKLPTDNEKAMVLLQLANINAQRNNWTGAATYVKDIKKLKVTEPTLKSQIDQFNTAFQNRGQMNTARAMGKQGMQMMQGMSGKRRRPKMR
jgi:tetratricopeptide (TPR) repeat protein